jgi:hypothetical protein
MRRILDHLTTGALLVLFAQRPVQAQVSEPEQPAEPEQPPQPEQPPENPAPETPAPTPEPPPAATPEPAPTPKPPAAEPLAGFSDGTAFLRSPDNFFQLLPNGRLQVDTYFYKSADRHPTNSVIIRRARAELAGWMGAFFFSLAGDFAVGAPAAANPVAQANLATTDDYGAYVPWGNLAVFQLGQYDAPFTRENRTSDKYFDFIERSLAVRALGIPSNKEVGLMVHGLLPKDVAYYSLGVFDGDGQNFRNADSKFDLIGRAWLSVLPTSLQSKLIARAGGSLWLGTRRNGMPVASQSTEAGLGFWSPRWNGSMMAPGPFELHQEGDLRAYALELNVNVLHRMGLRGEWVQRHQDLLVGDVSKAGTVTTVGHGRLEGQAGYLELWYWAIGDDLILGEPDLQLPPRVKSFGTAAPRQGLMAAVRVEYLTEDVGEDGTAASMAPGSSATGNTKVTAVTLGLNYWCTKRVRLSLNYGVYHFAGDSKAITGLPAATHQEWLFRFAFAL